MAMDFRVPPDILGARLRTARAQARLTQDAAAQALGLSRTTLVAIEAGRRTIDSQELRALAELYGTEEGAFLAVDRFPLELEVRYRALNSKSADAHQTEAALKLNHLATSAVELEQMMVHTPTQTSLPAISLLRAEKTEQVAEDAALELRQRLGLGISPIQDLFGLMESDLGLRVFERPLPSGVSGAVAFDSKHGCFVLLNSRHSMGRRRNTAAHEIGHALLKTEGLSVHFDDDRFEQREERFCDQFGRAFLMPATAVRRKVADFKAVAGSLTAKHVLLMAVYFSVSTEAMFRRLEGLELIADGSYDSLKSKGMTGKHLDKVRAEVGEAERPSLTPRMYFLASTAYEKELLTEQQIVEMLDLDFLSVRKLLGHFSSDLERGLELFS